MRGEGSEVRLRASEVVRVDASKLALYVWRRARAGAGRGTLDEHLELADWALANGLEAQAARELLDARQLDSRSRRLIVLERRLAEALRRRAAAEAPPAAPAPEATTAIAEGPTADPVELLPRLPEGSREHFTRRIQPLVLNGCGAGGCHGGARDDDTFALDATPLRGYGSASSTEHNLRAVLSAIDLDSPDDSRLLTTARGPHHGATPFTGARRQELLDRLAEWVRAIAAENREPLASEDTAESGSPTPETAAAVNEQPPRVAQADPAGLDRRAPTAAAASVGAPRDEFDANFFNRRFRRPQDDLPLDAAR